MSPSKEAIRTARADSRPLESDVTVYGATGFVGRHVCNYLIPAAIAANAKKPIRITLAGRSDSKLRVTLERLKSETGLLRGDEKRVTVDTFVADCADVDAVRSMASRSLVVLNCAGPFATYGTTVVEACALAGADYLDITGEVTWAGNMRKRFARESQQSGSRIISFCGFDSVPSDLAVFAAVRALQEQRGGDVNVFRAKTWHSAFGLANGGTIHTALDMPINLSHMIFDEQSGKMRKIPYFVDHPFHLASKEVQSPAYDSLRDQAAKSEWLNQLVTVDTELESSWFRTLFGGGAVASVPFFMAPVNAKVVFASAVALGYGKPALSTVETSVNEAFAYSERCLPIGFTASSALGVFSLIPAIAFQVIMMFAVAIFKIPILGKKFAMLLAPPGSGSPDYVNEMGFAEIYAEAHSRTPAKVNRIDRGTCRILFKGDPGNLVTAQCISESALSLILNRNELPPKSDDGFGTPAQLLGDVLIKRLKESPVRPVTFEPGFIMNDTESKWTSVFTNIIGICAAVSLALWIGPQQSA